MKNAVDSSENDMTAKLQKYINGNHHSYIPETLLCCLEVGGFAVFHKIHPNLHRLEFEYMLKELIIISTHGTKCKQQLTNCSFATPHFRQIHYVYKME